MLKKIPTFYILLVALLFTSALPLGLMALNTLRATSIEVEREQIAQLTARTDAHGATINEQLRGFENATKLAADQARRLLTDPAAQISASEQITLLQKYQRDANGVLGLDSWYSQTYQPQFNDDRVSNVFVNQDTALTPDLEREIVVTEKLNPLFDAIHGSGIGTQWIYLTLPDGMMRLFPWQANSGYPPDWKPQEISFYTAAAPERNPQGKAVWTAPYNDFSGAGLMVTNSDPIYDNGRLLGVMSQDYRIKDLQRQVLGFQIGQSGMAFLLDQQGNIIAHRDFNSENTPLGEELNIKLADLDPPMAPVVAEMLNTGRGVRQITDQSGMEWVVAFTPIEVTGWNLGLMLPRNEILQPVYEIGRNLVAGTIGLVVLAVLVSIVVARALSRPIVLLSNSAREIEASADAMEMSVDGDRAAAARATDLSRISGPREISNLVAVFSQMVTTLQKRINEIGSVYAMGQTITSAGEYEQTLQAILKAVQDVVSFDAAEISIAHENDIIVEAWQGEGQFNDTTGVKRVRGQGLAGLIAQRKVSILCPTVSEEALQKQFGADIDLAFLPGAVKAGVASFLGIPLSIGERLVGVLTLVHHTVEHFDEDDRRQLSRLAAQASIAIDNALQVRRRESALKKQILELQIEIDEVRKAQQVAEITETDYFRDLTQKAQRMRNRGAKSL